MAEFTAEESCHITLSNGISSLHDWHFPNGAVSANSTGHSSLFAILTAKPGSSILRPAIMSCIQWLDAHKQWSTNRVNHITRAGIYIAPDQFLQKNKTPTAGPDTQIWKVSESILPPHTLPWCLNYPRIGLCIITIDLGPLPPSTKCFPRRSGSNAPEMRP